MSGTQDGRSPRSVALVGPYGSGKSTLFDAMLEAAGSPVKRPPDPRNRPSTTEIRLGHCTYLGDRWSVLDCPGSVEFAHETEAALAIVDIAVLVCDPQPGRAMAAAPLLKRLAEQGVPHIVFINRIDTLDGRVERHAGGACRAMRAVRWCCARCRSPKAEKIDRLRRCHQRPRLSLPQGAGIGTGADSRRRCATPRRRRGPSWWRRWPIMTTRCWKRCSRTSAEPRRDLP